MQAQSAQQNQQQGLGIGANYDARDPNNPLYLFNLANEATWEPCDPEAPHKTKGNAAWMVGMMYKQVYIPMAILFMLPGAVMTQARIVARTGFMWNPTGNDADMQSPWTGIMRAAIAVFLIPATQLVVSYSIDVGNSLTYEVVNFKPYFDLNVVNQWLHQQNYDASAQNNANYIPNGTADVVGKDLQGKDFKTNKDDVVQEKQNYLTSTTQQWYNTLAMLLSQGVITLNAFQIVMMMYLFLLGPIAGALFAWPGVTQEAFKKVFANWMDGVVLLATWKFWWCIILLIMAVRLEAYQANGQPIPAATETFEMFMAGAFAAMLMYVPFNPFDFRPGDLVTSVLAQAQQQTPQGGSGAAAGGSAGGAGGSVTSGSGGSGMGGGKPGGGGSV
jgi:hypothetical protein